MHAKNKKKKTARKSPNHFRLRTVSKVKHLF